LAIVAFSEEFGRPYATCLLLHEECI